MSSILIQDCTVLQQPDDRTVTLLHGHDILVRDQRIEVIVPTGIIDPSHVAQVIDAGGQVAMPGLINTHAHVPMVLFRGLAEDVAFDRWFNEYIWPLENNLIEGDVYTGMQLGLAESIRAGVTTVNDHYFNMDEAAHAVEMAGMRATLGWAIFGSGGEAMLERSAQFAAGWQGGAHGRITTVMAPHAPYTCTDEYLRACARKAELLDLGIHIHAAETLEQTRTSLERTGKTPIQILQETGILSRPAIMAHACGVVEGDIERIALAGAGVAQCTKTYLKLGMEVAPVMAMRAAGIPVGVGSDGAASNNTLNLWEALRLMALIQKQQAHSGAAMPIPEVLYAATRGGADVLGMGDRLGAIEPGFMADIILLDLTGLHHQPLHDTAASLVYNMEASDVRTVLIDGAVVMRDRELLTLDENEIVEDVMSSIRRLSRRDISQRIQTYAG